jgi:dihydrofolate reductase
MRKVVADEWMTLDGVVQAPGQEDEDTSGGFRHGGWHMGYLDDIALDWVARGVVEAGGYLLGRRTYEIFAAHWPNASEAEQVLAEPLNTRPKYVASRTLSEPPGRRVPADDRPGRGGRRQAPVPRRRRAPGAAAPR